jgi:hypothetical protein
MSLMSDPSDKRMAETYQRVFRSPDGQAVFKDILAILKHFDTAETDADLVLQNTAKVLLYRCGAFLDHNVDTMVELYLSLPVVPPYGEDEEIDGKEHEDA